MLCNKRDIPNESELFNETRMHYQEVWKFLKTLDRAGLKIAFDIIPFHFKFFKGCLPQIFLGPLLNTLSHLFLCPKSFKNLIRIYFTTHSKTMKCYKGFSKLILWVLFYVIRCSDANFFQPSLLQMIILMIIHDEI